MRSPFNRPGYKQGEEAYKHGIVYKAFLRINPFLVNIYDIRQAMEGIKRDAHRKDYFDQGRIAAQTKALQQGHHVFRKKIVIFEYPQEAEVDTNTQP
ncbi:hypothetical protein D3C87_1795820 [compost metagenome]